MIGLSEVVKFEIKVMALRRLEHDLGANSKDFTIIRSLHTGNRQCDRNLRSLHNSEIGFRSWKLTVMLLLMIDTIRRYMRELYSTCLI